MLEYNTSSFYEMGSIHLPGKVKGLPVLIISAE